MLTSLRLSIGAFAALAVWTAAPAGGDKGKDHAGDKGHVMVRPSEIKWGPAPPGLPPGAQFAVLAGDPTKSVPFVIRAKLPDGYKVPPHWHPSDENVTVLQGTL